MLMNQPPPVHRGNPGGSIPDLDQSDYTDEIASNKNNSKGSKINPKFQSSKSPHIKDTYI